MFRHDQNTAGGVRDAVPELRAILDLIRKRWLAIGACAAATVAAGIGWLSLQPPVYRATATILLDQSQPTGGVLGELAALSSAPAAASEIALLRSRSLAEKTIQSPPDGSIPTPENPHAQRNQGLTTVVESPDQQPVRRIFDRMVGIRRGKGALHARARALADGAAEAIRVSFDGEGQIRLTPVDVAASPDDDAREARPQRPDGRYRVGGVELNLAVRGDVSRREFVVRRVSEASAVKRLLSDTRVVESQRNSGVIALTVDDSDPERAAAVANALCHNYFDLNVERGRKRASQTVGFIQSQLDEQLAALETAEHEVVDLQAENLDAIDSVATAESLIRNLSDLEVQRMRLDLQASSLSESLALLRGGDFDALGRIAQELDDPLAKSLLEQLSVLHMRLLLKGRSDGDPYALLLAQRSELLEERAGELAMQIVAVRETIQAIDDGVPGAYGFLSANSNAPGITVDPLTTGYLSEIARLEGEIASLQHEFLPGYPPLAQAIAALDELRAKVRDSLRGRLTGLQRLFEDRSELAKTAALAATDLPDANARVDRAALEDLRERVERQLASRLDAVALENDELGRYVAVLEERLGNLPEQQRRLASPMRRLETHKQIAAFLLTSLQEAEITRASTVAAADFIDAAAAPDLRYSPRIGFTLMLSSVLGLGLGLGLAWLRESLRRSLQGPSELEAVTGLPVLTTVPDFKHGKHRVAKATTDFIALRDDPHGVVAEAYRSLRANLRFAVGDVNALRTMAATSCAPGEGKSTTNIDIAWAFASGGRRVLLVDADMRRPSVHRYLKLDRGPGLAEVLAGTSEWRDVARSTDNPLLSVIPAGVLRASAGDALGTTKAQELIDEFTKSYDLVVFDLPPALAVADVETFAHRLDAVLLLYRSDGLPREAVSLATTRLRQAGAKLVGCVMNAHRADRSSASDRYQGDYGYGYTDAGGDGGPPALEGVEAALPSELEREVASASARDERF
ncbi:polysaccharide biosynthesis tyrosine autokinase [Engelhardtia mirabilis]|uniref:non-specific protein-tyrosine kinase n=1 Tax=Engelhardtia mirabilis TaxID=2528011 RepID=A0A518BJJ1_9BACT|nr:Tyrosine-protein kinase ptk [Planctomycetes bacterium Pla133]QDV01478.1 Tyrosine-protein kinase ptk [Planctomycetes bacterium Pla86]